jgi:16S rRNA (adenine1518-N6/adenine1519-N6)-dimethyltransferase
MTSSRTSTRQTLSYLRNLFEGHGIRPKRKLGQNFLIDLNLLDVLVREAELTRQDLALEIGSGTGSLTVQLAERAGAVLSIEIDLAFFKLAREATAGQDNVTLIHGDVLKNKNELHPAVLNTLRDLQLSSGCSRVKLVANLPYVVATPVISNLLLERLPLDRLVATVQLEIAERLTARAGTKAYGALSVFVQSLADVEMLRRLPPAAFWPRPQVASAIVLIRPDEKKRARVGDVQGFRHFLRDLYVHRRKNLRGALAGWPTGRRSKEEVDRLLDRIGLDARMRAEELDVEQHLTLCAAYAKWRE